MSGDRPAVVFHSRIKGFVACISVMVAIYILQSVFSSIFTIGFNILKQFS